MSWFYKSEKLWEWRGHAGAALPRVSECFPRAPSRHVRTQWEGASPQQCQLCWRLDLVREPPEKEWWNPTPALWAAPVHGSFAVTAGRGEDSGFHSHHRPAPWLTLSCSSGSSAHSASQRVRASLSPLQSVQGKSGLFSHNHAGSLNLLKTPQRGFPSIQQSPSEWDRRTDPFQTLQAIPMCLSFETTPLAVFTSVPVWDVLFLSRTFSYSFLNSPILSDHYPNLHIFIQISSLMLRPDQIPLK